MPILNSLSDRILDREVRVATALGFGTIPVTLAVSWYTLPDEYNGVPVLVAGLLGGLYYRDRTRSSSPTQAGLRIGVISGFDALSIVGNAIASGWAISPEYTVLAAVLGTLTFVFALVGNCLIAVVGARVGGLVGRFPPFRRGRRRIRNSEGLRSDRRS